MSINPGWRALGSSWLLLTVSSFRFPEKHKLKEELFKIFLLESGPHLFEHSFAEIGPERPLNVFHYFYCAKL